MCAWLMRHFIFLLSIIGDARIYYPSPTPLTTDGFVDDPRASSYTDADLTSSESLTIAGDTSGSDRPAEITEPELSMDKY